MFSSLLFWCPIDWFHFPGEQGVGEATRGNTYQIFALQGFWPIKQDNPKWHFCEQFPLSTNQLSFLRA